MLRAGFGIADITPPLGLHLAGHFRRRPAKGIHDSLLATALVLEADEERAAVVSCDLLGLSRQVVQRARELVHQQVGLAAEQVLLAATHTHAGPEVRPDRNGFDERYADFLVEKIATAVVLAVRDLGECELVFTRGREERISFNRRYWMRDGTVKMNPGVGNPDIVRPAGPIDPDVLGLWVMREGEPAGVVVNFACHLDVLGSANELVSADVPHYVRQTLSGALGRQVPVVYLNGCCGDINHIDVNGPPRQGGYEHSEMMGRVLAGEMLRSLMNAKAIQPGPVGAVSEMVRTHWRLWPEEEVKRAREILEDESVDKETWTYHRALRIVSVAEHRGEERELEVQGVRAGEAVIVGLPGEVFCQIGLDIKAQAALEDVMVAELSNDNPGYIPTEAAFDEGGYEVDSAGCAPETGRLLVEAGRLVVEKLSGLS